MAKGEKLNTRMNSAMLEKAKRQRLITLKKDTIRRIEFIRKKAVIEHQEIYHAIRDFFKEFLEQRYEFTTNELRAELKKIYISGSTRKLINTLLDDLQAIEYASVHYERKDIMNILDSFEIIVKDLVHTHTSVKSFWDKLKQMLGMQDDPQTILADLPVIEKSDEKHVLLAVLVERCYIALDKHQMHKAKVAYKKLLEEYSMLDDETKKQNYHMIEQTYSDIMNKQKMTKE